MTKKRDLKRRIRQRMASTGERYTVARQALLPDVRGSSATHVGGKRAMSTRTPLAIELITGAHVEGEAADRLRWILDRWSLDKYLYFDRVRLSADATESGSGPHTPLLAPADLLGEVDIALATFLHAQLHVATWDLPGASEAIAEAADRWQPEDVQQDGTRGPCAKEGHGDHVVVGVLQLDALAELLGQRPARRLMSRLPGSERLYHRVLSDRAAVSDLVERHHLALPAEPADFARRGTEVPLQPNGPTALLATGRQLEVDLAARLLHLHGTLDLGAWRFSPEIVIDTGRPNLTVEAKPVLSTSFAFATDALLTMVYVQVQAGWWAERQSAQVLEGRLGPLLDDFGVAPNFPRHAMLRSTLGCVIAFDAAARLFPPDDVTAAVERHPNRTIYAAIARRPGLVAQLATEGVAVTAP